MARRVALPRMSGSDFVARVLARPDGPLAPPARRGESGGKGEGAEGHAAEPPALAGASTAAEAPAAAAETVLALFDRGTPPDQRVGRALAAVASAHGDRVRAVGVPAAEVTVQLHHWQEERRPYDTFDFRRWPAIGVFRQGHLVTSFHPRLVFPDDRLQEREERAQLEIFLSKMVYFDPASVKEQKNIESEAEA